MSMVSFDHRSGLTMNKYCQKYPCKRIIRTLVVPWDFLSGNKQVAEFLARAIAQDQRTRDDDATVFLACDAIMNMLLNVGHSLHRAMHSFDA